MIPVTLMLAVTADGKIAKNNHHFADWTSVEDKQLFRKTAKEFGAFMVGKNTFDTFPGPLPQRLNVVFSRETNPEEIEGVKWVNGEPEAVLEDLESMGYKKVLLAGGANLDSLFLKKKLIDEIILTVEPKIFGAGISILQESQEVDLELQSLEKINANSFVVRYKVKY